MLACFSLSAILTPIGWIIVYALGICSAFRLDRARALRAVRGRIEATFDEIADTADAELASTHKESVADIKEPLFGALPLLSRRKQGKIIGIWREYRRLSVSRFPENDICTRVGKALGEKITTKKEAIEGSLKRLNELLK